MCLHVPVTTMLVRIGEKKIEVFTHTRLELAEATEREERSERERERVNGCNVLLPLAVVGNLTCDVCVCVFDGVCVCMCVCV